MLLQFKNINEILFQRLVNNIETHVQEYGRVLAIYFGRQGIRILPSGK